MIVSVEFKLLDVILIRFTGEPIVAVVESTYPSILNHVGNSTFRIELFLL